MISGGYLPDSRWAALQAATAGTAYAEDWAIVPFPPDSQMCTGCGVIKVNMPGTDPWKNHGQEHGEAGWPE